MILCLFVSLLHFLFQAAVAKQWSLLIQDETVAFAAAGGLSFLGMAWACWGFQKERAMGVELEKKMIINEIKVVSATLIFLILLSTPGILHDLLNFLLVQHLRLESSLRSSIIETFDVIVSVAHVALFVLISYFLGQQSCLIFRWIQQRTSFEARIFLFWNYVGALLASMAFAFWLVEYINHFQKVLLFSVVYSFLIISWLYLRLPLDSAMPKRLVVALVVLICISFFLREFDRQLSMVNQLDRLIAYGGYTIGPFDLNYASRIKRIQKELTLVSYGSRYQRLDWIEYRSNQLRGQLYLDGAFQFDSDSEGLYHESYIQGLRIALNSRPQKILIMGGGDALLSARILEHFRKSKISPAPKIDLVEIDPMVLESARKLWGKLEAGSLRKIQVSIQDAFHFIRDASDQWDMILLDFPDPRTIDLAKLFTQEFYMMVKKRLTKNGIVIFDFPSEVEREIIVATVKAAGFDRYMLYGKNQLFVYLEQGEGEGSWAQRSQLFPNKITNIGLATSNQVHSLFRMKLPQNIVF